MLPLAAEFQIPIQHKTEYQYFVHGDHPNFSPSNVTVYQNSIPTWVLPIDPPEYIPTDERPNANLLTDYQCDIETQTSYQHFTYRIWNAFDALNLSNIGIQFEPELQDLTVHECKIYRNGRWLNKLDMQEMRVIQALDNGGDLQFDGVLTAIFLLEDVRPGDMLDYSYSITDKVKSRFSDYSYLQFHERWEKIYGRIIKPHNRTFQTKVYPEDWNQYVKESATEYVWNVEPSIPYEIEPSIPSDFRFRPAVEFSEYTSWKDVALAEVDNFRLHDDLKNDPDAMSLVESWKAATPDAEERAILALRFVQDEIRYLGIEEGLSKIKPTAPIETFKRRFGDCKDKTQLYRAFLAELGIPSDPCLVHMYLKNGIRNFLPNPIVFNHVITRVTLPDRYAFADATALYEGGSVDELSINYGAGLILSDQTTDLTEISAPLIDREIDTQTHFEIQSGTTVDMTICANFYGKQANLRRARMKELSLDKQTDYYEELLRAQLDEFQVIKKMAISDDRNQNHITASITIRLKNPWRQGEKKKKKYFSYLPIFLYDYFDQDIDPERKYPLKLNHARIRESISVNGAAIINSDTEIDHSAFTFSADAENPNKLCLELKTHLDSLPADEIGEYCDCLSDALDNLEVLIIKK